MTRRRAARCPLERATITPRVIDGDLLPLAVSEVDVEEEGDHRQRQDDRANGRELVHPGKPVLHHVGRVATRHAHHAQPVLDEEGHVETDEENPEVDVS